MEPIKVQVSIELNLSEDVKQFVTSLISGNAPAASAIKPAATKPVASAAPATKPAATKPAAPAAQAEKPAETQEISIEDVRKALASKVANHRAEIKDKLDELGAPSVTKLDPAKYPEMLDFLNTLD